MGSCKHLVASSCCRPSISGPPPSPLLPIMPQVRQSCPHSPQPAQRRDAAVLLQRTAPPKTYFPHKPHRSASADGSFLRCSHNARILLRYSSTARLCSSLIASSPALSSLEDPSGTGVRSGGSVCCLSSACAAYSSALWPNPAALKARILLSRCVQRVASRCC